MRRTFARAFRRLADKLDPPKPVVIQAPVLTREGARRISEVVISYRLSQHANRHRATTGGFLVGSASADSMDAPLKPNQAETNSSSSQSEATR